VSEKGRKKKRFFFFSLSLSHSLLFLPSRTHTHTHTLSLSLSLARARPRTCTNTFTNIYKFLQSNKNLELKENIEPSASARPVNVSFFRTHTYFNLYLYLFLCPFLTHSFPLSNTQIHTHTYTQTHLLIYKFLQLNKNFKKPEEINVEPSTSARLINVSFSLSTDIITYN